MNIENAKQLLASEIKRALEYDERGDATLRNQVLRGIEDLPLPTSYVRAAIKKNGLLSIYKG